VGVGGVGELGVEEFVCGWVGGGGGGGGGE
jgi:hypothetical protein